MLFYPTTNPHTPPWKVAHHFQQWAASTLHTPGTHCRSLRCGGRRPGKGSPSSSATHSASCDAPSPSPALPASLPDLCHYPGNQFCPRGCGSPHWSQPACPAWGSALKPHKFFNVRTLTGKVETLVSYQVPYQNIHPQQVPQGGLPSILVGHKGIPLFMILFSGMRKLVPSTVIVQSVPTSWVPNLLSKSICGWGGGGGGDVRTGMEKERRFFDSIFFVS